MAISIFSSVVCVFNMETETTQESGEAQTITEEEYLKPLFVRRQIILYRQQLAYIHGEVDKPLSPLRKALIVEREQSKKPFLGGFRDKRNGKE